MNQPAFLADNAAARYRRHRPAYPKRLTDRVIALAGLAPGAAPGLHHVLGQGEGLIGPVEVLAGGRHLVLAERLAVGVVLPNADVAQWVNLVSALPPELRGDVDLFLSVWGDIAPSANAADLFNGTDVGRPSLLASIAYDRPSSAKPV